MGLLAPTCYFPWKVGVGKVWGWRSAQLNLDFAEGIGSRAMARAWGGTDGLVQRNSSPALFLDSHCLTMCDLRASSSLTGPQFPLCPIR